MLRCMMDSTRFKMVPVREKVDTGSDENFVSMELTQKHHIDPDIIKDLPIGQQKERTLVTLGNFTFTPKQEVTSFWHKTNDKKQRQTSFIIVESDLFDVLIGQKKYEDEAKRAVLVGIGRNKSEGRCSHD